MVESPLSDTHRLLNAQLADRALRGGAGVAIHLPVTVYLQVSSTCNLDCYMCSVHTTGSGPDGGRKPTCMDPDLFARVEREILPHSSRVSFGIGGEPTISKYFVDFVNRSAAAGQTVQLTTNGTRLDQDQIAETLARHVRDLQVSMDAATAATYERIRRGASWERLLRGFDRLNRHRGASEAEARCRLTLCFTLMRSNLVELPDFVDLAADLEADAIHAQHVIPVTEEGRSESLIEEPDRYDRVYEEATSRARRQGITLELPRPFRGDGVASPPAFESGGQDEVVAPADPLAAYSVRCGHPNQSIFVLEDGRVFSCCHPHAHRKMQVGNLLEQPFATIWNHRLLRNLRAGLRIGDVPIICRACSIANDPPSIPEDSEVVLQGPDLAEHYGDRDLDPLAADPRAWIERTGCLDYIADLRKIASDLERENPQVKAHAETLERELRSLRAHARTIDAEHSQMAAVLVELTARRAELLELATNLQAHASNLEAERPHLLGHIANLERQRRGAPLARHVLSTLFRERVTRQLDRLWRMTRIGRNPESRP